MNIFFSNGTTFFFIQYCRDLFSEYKNAKNYTHSLKKSQEIKELNVPTKFKNQVTKMNKREVCSQCSK
jgi:hypothetical protein